MKMKKIGVLRAGVSAGHKKKKHALRRALRSINPDGYF
jgi:hypothetical protein